jgi:GNAT superfamily N-acetyltransferase
MMARDLAAGDSPDQEARCKVEQSIVSGAEGTTTKANIAYAPASAVENEAIVTHVTELVNTIYAAEEAGFWKDGFIRTSTDEIRQCIRDGELALAWRPGASPDHSSPTNIMGCIRSQLLDARTGEFGLLVCDPAARGSGIGRDLLQFVEESIKRRGGQVMRLELLVGDGWVHPLKERLGKWYERAGYKLIRTGSIEEAFPRLVPMIAGPSLFRIYEKTL